MASKTASYRRRVDDWVLQARTAAAEIAQNGRPVIASLIAEQVAPHEYRVAVTQIDQSDEAPVNPCLMGLTGIRAGTVAMLAWAADGPLVNLLLVDKMEHGQSGASDGDIGRGGSRLPGLYCIGAARNRGGTVRDRHALSPVRPVRAFGHWRRAGEGDRGLIAISRGSAIRAEASAQCRFLAVPLPARAYPVSCFPAVMNSSGTSRVTRIIAGGPCGRDHADVHVADLANGLFVP